MKCGFPTLPFCLAGVLIRHCFPSIITSFTDTVWQYWEVKRWSNVSFFSLGSFFPFPSWENLCLSLAFPIVTIIRLRMQDRYILATFSFSIYYLCCVLSSFPIFFSHLLVLQCLQTLSHYLLEPPVQSSVPLLHWLSLSFSYTELQLCNLSTSPLLHILYPMSLWKTLRHSFFVYTSHSDFTGRKPEIVIQRSP